MRLEVFNFNEVNRVTPVNFNSTEACRKAHLYVINNSEIFYNGTLSGIRRLFLFLKN